ncbi:MAG: TrkA C-terminal domain-containing protein [Alistipes sp.]
MVFKIDAASPLIDKSLIEITGDCDSLPYRTVAISRDGETIIPRGNDRFQEGDNIYVIANQSAEKEVVAFSGKTDIDIKNMMILGGSKIGVQVASELQDEVNIKLVDYTPEKAYKLAEQLERTLIINEDGRNTDAMIEGVQQHGRFPGRHRR